MIGCAEFILGYDWTFAYLLREYGQEAVERYWTECISVDSQTHARELIIPRGFDGMEEYWGHTLAEEEAGYTSVRTPQAFRMDMYACPSQGLLRERGQENYPDYCEHCMGWIKPVMNEAGYVIHHEHDHDCKCWWEFVPAEDSPPPSECGELAGEDDIRQRDEWDRDHVHRWVASEKQG
jgi:hypothetical protein